MGVYFAIAIVATILAAFSGAASRHFRTQHSGADEEDQTQDFAPFRPTVFDFILVAVLVGFSALRYYVGTDYGMYVRVFSALQPTTDWFFQLERSTQEFGYTLLSLLIKSQGGSAAAVFWVTSILTIVPVVVMLKTRSRDLPFSVLLFILLAYFVSPFNIVRQGVAVALTFWASSFIGRNRFWFVALNVIAAMFHSSAIVAALIQLLFRHWRPTIRSAAVLLVTTAVAAGALFAVPALGSVVALINPRYETYLSAEPSAGVGTYLVVAAKLALIAYCLWLNQKIETDGQTGAEPRVLGRYCADGQALAYAVIGGVFLILGTQSVVAARMEYYFTIFLIILVPNLLSKLPKAGVPRVIISVGAAGYFALYLLNFSDLLPYETYFGATTPTF